MLPLLQHSLLRVLWELFTWLFPYKSSPNFTLHGQVLLSNLIMMSTRHYGEMSKKDIQSSFQTNNFKKTYLQNKIVWKSNTQLKYICSPTQVTRKIVEDESELFQLLHLLSRHLN